MKLSINLEDDQKPEIKAKLPISVFNQPFTSIFTTTTTTKSSISDLSFSLSTNFPSGPSLRLTYIPSPTAPSSPFSLSLKSGLGLFGSPHNSPLSFSANFSLSNTSPGVFSPTFSLHFKPHLGHFSLNKKTNPSSDSARDPDSQSYSTPGFELSSGSPSNSRAANGFPSDGKLGWQEVKLEPFGGKERDGAYGDENGNAFFSEGQLMWRDGKKGGFLRGAAVKASTVVPLTKSVMVNLRWGVHLPGDFGVKMPYLTVNKIGIERRMKEEEVKKDNGENKGGDMELLRGMCFWMRRDLEQLEKENRDMKQSLEDMRMGVLKRSSSGRVFNGVVKKQVPVPSDSLGEFEQWKGRKNDGASGQRELKKPVLNDFETELQKAIKAAAPQ